MKQSDNLKHDQTNMKHSYTAMFLHKGSVQIRAFLYMFSIHIVLLVLVFLSKVTEQAIDLVGSHEN